MAIAIRELILLQLKPPCVELSQLTLRFKTKNATGKQVIKSAETLSSVLLDVSNWEPRALNDKLAEYAFFPLSHIFRDSRELPVRAVEVALQCLDVLISCGWRDKISPELGKQLLILLSFLAGGSAVEANTQDVNEELGTAAFKCLQSLFDTSKNAGLDGDEEIQPENIPVLGHAFTVALDGVKNGPSIQVRLAASNSLESMIVSISDEETLRGFFPGIVSTLTKVIHPGGQRKVSYKPLQRSLQTLEKLLKKVISDERIFGSSDRSKSKQKNLDSWVEGTSRQVKLALANIVSLRYYERSEVRLSLFRLCVSILENCKRTLHQCTTMITESLIVLSSQRYIQESSERMDSLRRILFNNPQLLETVKNSLHDWILALPRIMLSNDDSPKTRGIDRILAGFKLISSQHVISDVLNDAIAFNLRASVSTAIQASSSQKVNSVSEASFEVARLLQSSGAVSKFPPVLFNEVSQKDTLVGLQTLAQQLKILPMSSKLKRGIIETLRTLSGDEQLANLWLSIQLLRPEATDPEDVNQYLDIQDNAEDAENRLLDEVYSFSIDILSRSAFEDESSWKLQCLALEIVALQAHRQQQDFRPELVEALYPTLERMGSNNAALQRHAMTCLNLMSNACAYPSPAALITDNADYLVNALALKLNTFEISPQAPQVLVMMIKLSGPGLIPYLDDLIESIFSILACFHGYQRLVESVFIVLHAIVEESAKSPLLALEPPTSTGVTKIKPIYRPMELSDVAERIRSRNTPIPDSDPDVPPPITPQGPWQSDSSKAPAPSIPEQEEAPPPPPVKLLNTISLLTQHHLTSSSAPIVLSLLSLLSSAFPPLAAYPDTLLPLLATLFPLLFTRLHDPTPAISAAAAETLSQACAAGGDFLSSRFDDAWPDLFTLYAKREREFHNIEEKLLGHNRAGGPRKRTCDSLRGLIIAVVQHVGVRTQMEDSIFDMLGAHLDVAGVRQVLDGLNPDFLWLVEEKARMKAGGEKLEKPLVPDGWELRDLDLGLE